MMNLTKRRLIAILVCQLLIGTSSSAYLDSAVFRNLSAFQLPKVSMKKLLNINFSFDTTKNEMIDCVSYNATYQTKLERSPYIVLHIPIEAVELRGKYFSSVNIQLPGGKKIYAQSNFGTYRLSMRKVDLNFELGFRWTPRGIVFEKQKCLPVIPQMRMRLSPSVYSSCSLDSNAVEEYLEQQGQGMYSNMFCEALETVLQQPNHHIVSALIKRVVEKINANDLR